jgi:HSP20 family protein
MVRDIFDIEKEFRRMREEMDRLFEDFSSSFNLFGASVPMMLPKDEEFEDLVSKDRVEAPKSNYYETEKEIVITAEIPGATKEDIKLSVEGNVLKISAVRTIEKKREDKGVHKVERYSTTFYRTYLLPEYANVEKIEANYENGVLEIKIPKRIEIKGGGVKYIDISGYKKDKEKNKKE